ncbi:MAG: winged helix-turn-helix transcriptional regulator [Candidatus Aenigmarchaeota archaeon]|jgi:DNA-binding HxlR family transcriptional regulator|nr:winged helix-turn-helix transcriptional regulator [Candidatus Aenigmarchaeota archaeon]
MAKGEKGIIRLLGKKYTYEMLMSLEKSPKRFKALSDACTVEKMRVQRLRELESLELIKVRAKRLGGRSVSIYSISEKGRKVVRLAEGIKRLEPEKSE